MEIHSKSLPFGLRIAVTAGVFAAAISSASGTPAIRHATQPSESSAAQAAPARTTFNFIDMPVRSALQLIAEEGNFNLVLSDSVQGTVSLHLVNVTWAQALDVVLRLKGLRQRVDGNTMWVTSADGH